MLRAEPGEYVQYLTADHKGDGTEPIVAWDDDGEPLILGRRGLVPAQSAMGSVFHKDAALFAVERENHKVVAVIRAEPGWRISFRQYSDNARWTNQIIAWLITESGEAYPLHLDFEEGPVSPLGREDLHSGSFSTIVPPGAEDPSLDVTPLAHDA